MLAKAVAPVMAVLALAATGHAQSAARCQADTSKAYAKYVQTRSKLLQKCEDGKVSGRLPASQVCANETQTATLVARARDRLLAKITASCGGADGACGTGDDLPLASIGWGSDPTCPGFPAGSCSGSIASCGDVGTCVACVGDAAVDQSIALYYGGLASGQFGSASAVNRCQRAIGRYASKFLKAKSKTLARCWQGRFKGQHANDCPSPGDGRAALLIQRAEARARSSLCNACGGADAACGGSDDLTPAQIGFAASCPSVTVPGGSACGGPIGDLSALVDCVACVTEFDVDCVDSLGVHALDPYPAECRGGPTTTTTSTTQPPASTTSTSTTQPPGSTTTTTLPPGASFLDFTTRPAGGVCGHTYSDTAGTAVLKNLTCGGLSLGAGGSTVPEGPTPDGSTSRFTADCVGTTCTLGATTASGPSFDCTDAGCKFGAPLPIVNGSLSTCVQNTFAAPATGTLDTATGAASTNVSLDSNTVVTGVSAQPCPICRSGSVSGPACAGTPGSPCTGVCEGSPNQGSPCVSTNSQGLSRDCPLPASGPAGNRCYKGTNNNGACTSSSQCPGGGVCAVFVGQIGVNLTPLATSTRELSSSTGLFCPSQASAGCFTNPNSSSCRLIRETGVPSGPITPNVAATATLASTFCVPATGNLLIDGAASLPGPGAITLPGTVLLLQASTTTSTMPSGSTTTSTSTTAVPTTTSTSTSTAATPTTTSTSTTTTLPAGTTVLDFTTTPGAGVCGTSRDGTSGLIQNLGCGTLNLGGGGSSVPEGPVPDGATSRYVVTSCAGSDCTLAPTNAPAGVIDCTGTGCNFGPPLPIPNAGLSTCIVNTLAAPGSGTVNTATGVLSLGVPLDSHVFVTGNEAQPCPLCSATGSPSNPGVGTCNGGTNSGGACVSTNSQGLSSDCPPTGSDLGSISVDLTPVVTGTASDSDLAGLFCPGQTAGGGEGCFGSTACRSFSQTGTPAGALVPDTPQPVALASAFCIPATGNLLIDGAASLPGPGAASLSGTVTLSDVGVTTTTTTLAPPTTTSTTGASTTSTPTTTSTSTTTLLPPLLPLTVEFSSTGGGGTCGSTRNGAGTIVQNLACGDLALGGGASTLPPSTLPDGAVNHFALNASDLGCVLSLLTACPLSATTSAGPGFDCTTTGCFFGPPVPVPNGGLSVCSVSTFASPSSGTVNLVTGATTANVALDLHLFVTGNSTQPCPRCSATGTPGAPGSGTCDRGARAGLGCTTMNSHGLSKDCQPGGSDGSFDLGSLLANLSPVTTGTASKSNPLGLFCPGQTSAGCFGAASCRSITETGAAPNAALSAVTPQPATLASTFCVPASGNLLVDGSADLPGPAAISLPGTIRSQM